MDSTHKLRYSQSTSSVVLRSPVLLPRSVLTITMFFYSAHQYPLKLNLVLCNYIGLGSLAMYSLLISESIL
uniref:Uncharacterized protein n=1 Tax=Pararge aegeria TaxID=116150 RepID=S4NPJ1_9NEOP